MLLPQLPQQQDYLTVKMLTSLILDQECFLHKLLLVSAHSSPELFHLLLLEL